jgi:threonine/homoserine efflux transporter RhtA
MFQLKMPMIPLGVAITISFVRALHHTNYTFERNKSSSNALTHTLAIFTLVLFVAIAVAGRWIAYTWHG